jgi:hypothetical protein
MQRRWLRPLSLGGAAAIVAALALWLLPAMAGAYTTPGSSGLITFASIDASTSQVEKVSDAPLTYRVYDNLTIAVGDTLLVSAGTEVEFQNHTQLLVLGGLEVRGTSASPVKMRVIPDDAGASVDWLGISADGAGGFTIEHAQFNATIDIALANASAALVRDVYYEGRLIFVNVTGGSLAAIQMRPGPVDVGRVPLWLANCANITVMGANLNAGTGWGGDGVHIEGSTALTFEDLQLWTDNVNLVGFDVAWSADVVVRNYTFGQGPNLGSPNQAVQVTDSDAVWFEHIDVTYVGTPVVGSIYGQNSNATIANSTFPAGLMNGSWGPGGRLVSLNATRLPVRAYNGGQVWEYELVTVEVNWTSGGPVAEGAVHVENASWNVTDTVTGGRTPWMWLLREWNDSVNATVSASYTARAFCNCSGGSVTFAIADEPGTFRRVQVEDTEPPVVVVTVQEIRTGEPTTLDGAESFDNDQVAAFAWTGTVPYATGIPCSQAVCSVTFFAPGDFTILVTATDPSGNSAEKTVRVTVVDVTNPHVEIQGVDPARPGEGNPFTVSAVASDNDAAFLPGVKWFVDGTQVVGDTLIVTLQIAAIGPHTVEVEVSDDAGNLARANVSVEVHDATPPEVGLWTPPTGLKAGGQVQLNGSVATDNVGVVSWRWRVVGPGTDYNLTGESPTATFPSAGAYNVTLTAKDVEGNEANRTFTVNIEAIPKPSPGIEVVAAFVALAAAAAGIALWRVRRR